jgi:addiction module HigA family antidote
MRNSVKLMPPVHPGEILREDFMRPLGLTVNGLALDLHVPATRIAEIVHQRRRITADTALRLARYFNTDAEFWLNLRNFYDLEISRRSGSGGADRAPGASGDRTGFLSNTPTEIGRQQIRRARRGLHLQRSRPYTRLFLCRNWILIPKAETKVDHHSP